MRFTPGCRCCRGSSRSGLLVSIPCDFPPGITVSLEGSDGSTQTVTSPDPFTFGTEPGVTYTVSGDAGRRFTRVAATFTAGPGPGDYYTAFALADGYICECGPGYTAVPGGQQVPQPGPVLPISETLTYSDETGSYTLYYVPFGYGGNTFACLWKAGDGEGGTIGVEFSPAEGGGAEPGWYWGHSRADGSLITEGRVQTFHCPSDPGDRGSPAGLFTQAGVTCIELLPGT